MTIWILALVSLSTLWWAAQALALVRAARGLPRVADMPELCLPDWPTLSVVVPARNEAAHLERAELIALFQRVYRLHEPPVDGSSGV